MNSPPYLNCCSKGKPLRIIPGGRNQSRSPRLFGIIQDSLISPPGRRLMGNGGLDRCQPYWLWRNIKLPGFFVGYSSLRLAFSSPSAGLSFNETCMGSRPELLLKDIRSVDYYLQKSRKS